MTARGVRNAVVALIVTGAGWLGGAASVLARGRTGRGAGRRRRAGGEANLILPDLHQVTFLGGIDGHTLLLAGLVVCALGLVFGLVIYTQLKKLPVHQSMREISELIYETCKTYLVQQGKFLLILVALHRRHHRVYFGELAETQDASGAIVHGYTLTKVAIILLFSLVGIAGSYGVAWFGIRVNTFANSRTAFAALARQAVSLLRRFRSRPA